MNQAPVSLTLLLSSVKESCSTLTKYLKILGHDKYEVAARSLDDVEEDCRSSQTSFKCGMRDTRS